jgi:hypothetical protein
MNKKRRRSEEDPTGAKARKLAAKIARDEHWRLWEMLKNKYPLDGDVIGALMVQGVALVVQADEIEVEEREAKTFQEAGTKARRSDGRKGDIKAAYKKFINRPKHTRAGLIAKLLGRSPQYVRTVIREARKTGEIV